MEDIDQEGPQLLSTFEELLLANPSDIPARFVALSTYYALAHLPSVYTEDFVSEARDRHAKNLAYLIRLVPTEDCHDWRTTRWEILNAYVISDWDRALELYNRAERLHLLPLAEIQVLRAQFRFLAAFGKATEPSLDSLSWPPDVYSPGSIYSERLFLEGLTSIKRKCAFANCDNDMLRHAALDLETALPQRQDLSPAYRAVLARCLFLTRHFQDAAKEYERLETTNVLNVLKPVVPDHAVYLSAAVSYRESDEPEKAITVLEKCAANYPDAKGVYLEIAKLRAKELNLPAIAEALREEGDRNPEMDLWSKSPLIVAGEILTDTEEERATLREKPEYEQISTLLSEYWPTFANLDSKAREEWIYGVWGTHFCTIQGHMRGIHRRKAITAFAQAVEIELLSRVFKRFREHALADQQIRALAGQAIKEKSDKLVPFAKFIEEEHKPLGIGQMAYILDHSSKNPPQALFQDFGVWVQQNYPRLRSKVVVLYQIARFRNPALHNSVSIETIDSIPDWCRGVIESLSPA